MNFFSLPRLTFQHHLHKVHMDFYLLRFTYVNDVNVGRNILMNSQLKRNFFVSSDKKKWNKTEKDRKYMENENNTDESDFSENKVPHLNYLKPFEFERKTNIGDINSSQKQPSELFCKKGVLRNFSKFTGKRLCQSLFLTALGLQLYEIESKNTFFYRTSLLAASSKACDFTKIRFTTGVFWWFF